MLAILLEVLRNFGKSGLDPVQELVGILGLLQRLEAILRPHVEVILADSVGVVPFLMLVLVAGTHVTRNGSGWRSGLLMVDGVVDAAGEVRVVAISLESQPVLLLGLRYELALVK